MSGGYVIRYRYPGTVADANGVQQPVGLVYALNIDHLSGRGWSYTKDPQEATDFSTRVLAEHVLQTLRYPWPEAEVVSLQDVQEAAR